MRALVTVPVSHTSHHPASWSGSYSVVGASGMSDGIRYADPLPELQWSSESLAGSGIR